MNSTDYSRLVKALREKRQLTQEALAHEIGIAFSTLNKWENGHRQPQPFLARRIAELAVAAGVDIQKYGNAAVECRNSPRAVHSPPEIARAQQEPAYGTAESTSPVEALHRGTRLKTPNRNVDNLYRRPIQSTRTGPLYNAFSYPTKIDPEAVAVFLATHTSPGDTILDPFSGSGTTGVAACLCDRPTPRMLTLASEARVKVTWGPRNAVLYELSPIGSLLARVMTSPPDPHEFELAASQLLDDVTCQFGWAYESLSPSGESGIIRHVIWSEIIKTPCCGSQISLWDAAAQFNPAALAESVRCPNCGNSIDTSTCARVVSRSTDAATGTVIKQRKWHLARVYGKSPSGNWSRPPTSADRKQIAKIRRTSIPGYVPTGLIGWGDLYRSGYHTGISRFHHLYTDRNLRTLAHLWGAVDQYGHHLSDALKVLVLSYNASHSTLMTRVVAKTNQKDFVVTGAQSGVLYISGLPVEKNVIEGIRRKTATFAKAFALTRGSRSAVEVVNASSTSMQLADSSIDYVFTDPPFGDFIPYAEVNQINESWIGQLTDRAEEAVISPSQGKTAANYACLLGQVFSETARVLKPHRLATVVFHASKTDVWQALGDSLVQNGFTVERTSVLDKTQPSFKQAVHEGGTRGDAVFLLRNDKSIASSDRDTTRTLDRTIDELEIAANGNPAELNVRRMYSRYVAQCIASASPVAISAPDFYRHLSHRRNEASAGER